MLVVAFSRISDYSRSNYIPILDGNVLVWERQGLIRHTSNLTEFTNIIDETDKLSELFPQSHMRKLLDVDIDHVRSLLSVVRVHHRTARSLDFLGTVLKVVAGTPDASDFRMIKLSESKLIDANNMQVVINTETQKQINQLTSTVNEIIKAKKANLVDTPHLYEALLARNRMLTTEIQNLILTITLARSGIVNPTIFDHNDLKSILNEHPPEVPIVNLMEASSIKVLQSENIVHVLITYPKIKSVCNKIAIYPVSHQHTILQLQDNIIADCDGDVLATSGCTTTNFGAICKVAKGDNCARALYAGSTANCRSQPSDLRTITEVDDGVIIINDSSAKVSADDGPEISIHGTYLITFERSSMINGTQFTNQREMVKKSPAVAGSPLLNIISHDPVLSLPELHLMNTHNLRVISEFKEDLESSDSQANWLISGIILSAAFSCFIVIYHFYKRKMESKKVQEVINKYSVSEAGHELSGGIVNK